MIVPLVLLVVVGVAGATDPRIKDAEGFAAHGEPDTARAAYQAVLDELSASGASGSARLHYNIGTLALGSGDVSSAVVHLLAAERRAPLDDDIRHNLAEALSRRADQVEGGTSMPFGARLPPTAVRFGFGACLLLLGAVLAAAGHLPRRVSRNVVLGAIAATVASGALWLARLHAERAVVVVVARDTEARPQPDATAAGFTVHAGLTGTVVDDKNGFSRVRLENGVDVWIERDATVPVP
jgi:hypothetical protein